MTKNTTTSKLDLKEIISLSLLFGFLGIVFFVIWADVFVFEGDNHSEMSNLLIGALVGYMATIITTIYKNSLK